MFKIKLWLNRLAQVLMAASFVIFLGLLAMLAVAVLFLQIDFDGELYLDLLAYSALTLIVSSFVAYATGIPTKQFVDPPPHHKF